MATAWNYDDELLMAFVDGVLDDPLRTEVAQAIEDDPGLAKRAAALAEGERLAKFLYEPLADVPVPVALHEHIERLSTKPPTAEPTPAAVLPFRPTPRTQSSRRWLPVALAAGVALLVAGPIGFQLGRIGVANPTPAGPVQAGTVDPLVDRLLSKLPSGEAFSLESGGTFTVISSFEIDEGRFCREFEVDGERAYLGVACMADQGWRYNFLSAQEAGQSVDDGFSPASSVDLLDTYLAGENASPPFSAADEIRRLSTLPSGRD